MATSIYIALAVIITLFLALNYVVLDNHRHGDIRSDSS